MLWVLRSAAGALQVHAAHLQSRIRHFRAWFGVRCVVGMVSPVMGEVALDLHGGVYDVRTEVCACAWEQLNLDGCSE